MIFVGNLLLSFKFNPFIYKCQSLLMPFYGIEYPFAISLEVQIYFLESD